ncbi:DNA polymerase III subunit epsilon domain protein (plasmid) [Candidatus Megaera polyxenophila]|nr:DNA polymerase III subunit epsilon domain protein [Candidatus Megaera polyxenophila]
MQHEDIENLATILNNSGQYRVTKKYQRPAYYNTGNENDKMIGVFLDIEATGLSYTQDKLIELGMVKFEYNKHGYIFRLLDDFNGYQDPGIPIPEYITELTGINDDMVRGRKIEENAVANYLQDVDLIIAHNAQFDRTFLEAAFPSLPAKAWGCLMYDVNWDKEGISSRKLEYIAYKFGFFHEGHRAINDCLAGVHLLAQQLPKSQEPVLKELITQSAAIRFKLYAVNSPYDSKELLKARGYRWSMNQNNKYRAWSIELTEDKVVEEVNYLRSNIYNTSSINIPVEILDAYSRFSSTNSKSNNHVKYRDKLEWFQKLCTS